MVDGRTVLIQVEFEASRSEVYSLARSVRFFEKTVGVKASDVIILTLIIDPRDVELAEKLGIKLYSDVDHVCL
jgi:hypothetical protein